MNDIIITSILYGALIHDKLKCDNINIIYKQPLCSQIRKMIVELSEINYSSIIKHFSKLPYVSVSID